MKPLNEIFPKVPADINLADLDLDRLPQHVAIIMDGNGRWAKQQGWKRLKGHHAGVEAVREAIRFASDLGIRYLTIYSFSSENWSRPMEEVVGLMDLLAKAMLAEVDGLHEEGSRVMTIGDLGILPEKTRNAFLAAQEKTKDNTGLTLVIAVNYGGRDEIIRSANRLRTEAWEGAADLAASMAANGASADEIAVALKSCRLDSIAASDIEAGLDTAGMPDPELLIRTSGEVRVSNFLLWQIAYSEFVISDVLWPDFDRYEFLRCMIQYQNRDRRFGGVK